MFLKRLRPAVAGSPRTRTGRRTGWTPTAGWSAGGTSVTAAAGAPDTKYGRSFILNRSSRSPAYSSPGRPAQAAAPLSRSIGPTTCSGDVPGPRCNLPPAPPPCPSEPPPCHPSTGLSFPYYCYYHCLSPATDMATWEGGVLLGE